MTERSTMSDDLSRRDLLCAAFASAAGLAVSSGAAPASAPEVSAKLSLQQYDKVEPQKYPWGWIRWLMNSQIDPKAEMTLGIVQVEANQANPLHMHPNSAEYLHMLSGSCEHRVGDRWVTLKAGDTLRVPKGVPHCARTKEQAFRALIVYDTGARQMVPVTEGKPAEVKPTK